MAYLVGVHPTVISRYENGSLMPGARSLMALEVVFRRCGRHLFSDNYKAIEDKVMRRAARLDGKLQDKTDPISMRKRALLSRMARGGDSADAA